MEFVRGDGGEWLSENCTPRTGTLFLIPPLHFVIIHCSFVASGYTVCLLHVQNFIENGIFFQSRNGTPYNKTLKWCIFVTMFFHIDMFSSWCIFFSSTVVDSLIWIVEYQTKLKLKMKG